MDSGIAEELRSLLFLSGSDFVAQLKKIVTRNEFHPYESDSKIFITGGKGREDFPNLINAAQKAVKRGYTVYILPNPDVVRTADFIFIRKGVYKLYDLKKSSADNRLIESIGQTNRVLLNITSDYNPSSLARSIKRYFENSSTALEVLVFKGKKTLSITRDLTLNPLYYKLFMKRYMKGK
ncbi:MAG: hypothetical protein IJT04_00645 [Bacteroidales bacterium]|nr:hypothetical protein [Bacteroidales bacterium]